MAEKEIILQGDDGQVDELVLTTHEETSCSSLEDCVRMLFPQEGESKPRLRFKGFEGDWKPYRLGDVGYFKSNGVDKKIYPGEAMINLLNYMDVYNFRKVTKANCKDLMQVSASPRQIEECDIKAGDVFFTPTSETAEDIGHVMVIEEDLPNTCYSYHIMRYRPNEGVFYPTFPDYGFQTHFVREQMRIAAKGVQRFVLSKNDFESLLVYAPCLEEQEKITSFMRRLDNQMIAYQKQFEELKQLKSACLETMFPQLNESAPALRFNGFDDDWVVTKLSEISKKVTKKNTDLAVRITLTNSAEFGVINQLDFFDHDIANGDNVRGYYVVENDDFVYNPRISSSAPVGPINRNQLGYAGVMSPLYYVFKVEGIDKDYLSCFFKTNRWHKFMFDNGNTGARFDRLSISDEVFGQMPIRHPKDSSEQKLIAEFFNQLDSKISAQHEQLERLKEMK